MTAPIVRWRTAVQRWKQWPRGARWSAAAALLLVLALGLLVSSLPGVVRNAVAERAERRGLTARVGAVRLGLARLWLHDIVVSDRALPEAGAELDAVELRLSWRGVSSVHVHGGSVRVAGQREALLERWQSLRGPQAATADEERGSHSSRRRFELDGVHVRVRADGARELAAWGLALREAGPSVSRWTADLVRGRTDSVEAELRAVEIDVSNGRPRRVARVDAVTATVRVYLGSEPPVAAAPGLAVRPPPPASAGTSPALPAVWALGRASVERLLAPGFQGAIVALNVDVIRAAESLRVGPSRVVVARDAERVSLELVPHVAGSEGGTPLRLAARVPLSAGVAEIDLSGGPVSLSALGIREGDFGLVGVRDARLDAEAKVRLDPERAEVDLTTRGRLENARLFRPALASSELSGLRLGWRLGGSARLDGTGVVLRDGELSMGDVRAELEGEIERTPERTRIALHTAVPLAACSALLEALPRGAAPLLEGVVLDGTFSLDSRLDYDSAKPDATTARVNVKNECRVKEVPPEIAPQRFRAAWRRDVKAADGSLVSIESGPGSPDWTPYEEISPYMETAVIVCEDEGFFMHRGFAYRAIESSIRQNLAAGRFLRGASTVSMQLAKNVYLGREKTLSRKLQESVLTLLLEQELSKHELMELYLNVIEYGPGIYGIRQAARYYFNEEPRNLSLGQALYLGTILPNPDSHHFLPDGRVSGAWTRYLQKLMHIAHKIRRISDEELAEGLQEQVAFRKPNLLGNAIAPVEDAAEEEPPPPELDSH